MNNLNDFHVGTGLDLSCMTLENTNFKHEFTLIGKTGRYRVRLAKLL